MKILVTGGAGFIGSHVVDDLISSGNEVVVVDDLSSGKVENVNIYAKFYLMDIRSKEINKVFEIEKPDIVSHFAAQTSVPFSISEPIVDLDINLLGLLNILQACKKYGTRKVIFISTGGAIYGDADVRPTPESFTPEMITPYALTKYTSEKYLAMYNKLFDIKYTVMRLSNVYGPRQIAKGESGVVPIFINNLINNKSSVLYSPVEMPQGATRDYIYVADVCRAHLQVLDEKADNQVYNIGTGKEIFMEEIYCILQQAANKTVPIIKKGERFGDVKRSALNCSKALEDLGWKYEIEPELGLRMTWNYYINLRN